MINFSTLQSLTIPEGVVTQIADASGRVLWALSSDKVILEVKKITSDTYAAETTYTGEQFILLDIYPKTNGTVKVTYGGLTKTITDTSGAEEPNAQQVYFGAFNGVSDSVETPASGELTIGGDCSGFGVGSYAKSSKSPKNYCSCITAITDFGSVGYIPKSAFYSCTGLTSVTIPASVTSIGDSAFYNCTGLTSATVSSAIIYDSAFVICTGLTSVTIDRSVTNIEGNPFAYCKALTNFVVDSNNEHYSSSGAILFNKDITKIIAYPTASGHYTVPASVTSIGDFAFSDCTNLTSVTIPASVTSIGNSAFVLGNGNSRTVTMLSSTPPILGVNAFYNLGTQNIIVPVGSGDTYKAAENWSDYADADLITEAS